MIGRPSRIAGARRRRDRYARDTGVIDTPAVPPSGRFRGIARDAARTAAVARARAYADAVARDPRASAGARAMARAAVVACDAGDASHARAMYAAARDAA